MQTNKIREEFGEDMSVFRGLSIVLDRKPELRLLWT